MAIAAGFPGPPATPVVLLRDGPDGMGGLEGGRSHGCGEADRCIGSARR